MLRYYFEESFLIAFILNFIFREFMIYLSSRVISQVKLSCISMKPALDFIYIYMVARIHMAI